MVLSLCKIKLFIRKRTQNIEKMYLSLSRIKNLIHMKNNDWKDRLNIVYSTNPDFKYDNGEEEEVETLDKKQQKLRVR